ncbi:MAG: hypothetical protein HRT35_38715, partial [Algicola sp.]|nr:hypothetical protein [Algicola sp.]
MLASVLFIQCAYADETKDKKIQPFDIDTTNVGSVDSAPFINGFNEVTGQVNAALPNVGIAGFSISPSYSIPSYRENNASRLDKNGGNLGLLGVGWHFDFGHLVVKPRRVQDNCGYWKANSWEEVHYVDGNGSSTQFSRELFNYDAVGKPVYPGDANIPSVGYHSIRRDRHFTDQSGRVLTRELPEDYSWDRAPTSPGCAGTSG